jgi:CDP-diacylglycerol--serine O-phosphatidyltransferase
MENGQGQPQPGNESSRRMELMTSTSGALNEAPVSQAQFTQSGRLPAVEEPRPGARTVRRHRRRMQALSMLPSILTLGNGVCGIAAIIEMFKAYVQLGQAGQGHAMWHLNLAAFLIGGGMLFDGLDGKVARLTNTSGRFGAELDSLCDALTFGLAPAMLLWTFGQYLYGVAEYSSRALWAVAVLYACCAVLRLARFNAETEPDDDHMTFSGMPSPGAACGMVSMFLALSWFSEEFAWMREVWAQTLLAIIVPLTGATIGLLMVTRIRYVHFMNRLFNKKQSFRALILVVLAVALLAFFDQYWKLIIPAGVLVYTASGPVYFAYRFLRGRGVLGRRLQLAERQKQHRERVEKFERNASREAAKQT